MDFLEGFSKQVVDMMSSNDEVMKELGNQSVLLLGARIGEGNLNFLEPIITQKPCWLSLNFAVKKKKNLAIT